MDRPIHLLIHGAIGSMAAPDRTLRSRGLRRPVNLIWMEYFGLRALGRSGAFCRSILANGPSSFRSWFLRPIQAMAKVSGILPDALITARPSSSLIRLCAPPSASASRTLRQAAGKSPR